MKNRWMIYAHHGLIRLAEEGGDGGGGTGTEGADADAADATEGDAEDADATDSSDGADDLGDAGKKALKTERDARKKAEADAKKARDEAAAIQAKLDGREAEFAAEQEAQKVKDEALAAANKRIVSAELRAAATGKLADPMDALAFIDITDFEVSDDGATDADAITAAIADLIERKPHLAARGGSTANGPQPDRSQGATDTASGSTTAQQFAAAITRK